MSWLSALIADYITAVIMSCFILSVSCGTTPVIIIRTRCILPRLSGIIIRITSPVVRSRTTLVRWSSMGITSVIPIIPLYESHYM
jgi:hypothetical protein